MFRYWKLGKRIYNMDNPREVRRCVIFCIRTLFYRHGMEELWQFFHKTKLLQQVAEQYPFVYEQPTRAFFYNKSTFSERASLVMAHMNYLCTHLTDACVLHLYNRKEWILWSKDNLVTSLSFEPGQRKEGLLSVMIRLDDRPFYQMIFWIAPGRDGKMAMWIGAMQGPNMDGAQGLIKQVTKRCHGCRPKNLALFLSQGIARALGLSHIYAVSNAGYYANNHIRINRKLKTDFGAFWEESGGTVTEDARFYELPLTETRKTMEEVPTRKRAVYKRRFALLDEIDAAVKATLGTIKRVSVEDEENHHGENS